jgi:putative oxidoreductase
MHISNHVQGLHRRALLGAERLAFLAPLLARFTVGVAFLESGWGKVHNLDRVTEFFTELGIPAPAFQATFVSWVELVGGALLLLGLGTRLAAVPLLCTMIVALLTAKAEDITGVGELVGAIEFTYLALLAWLALAGGGAGSLDRVIAGRAASGAAPAARALSTPRPIQAQITAKAR